MSKRNTNKKQPSIPKSKDKSPAQSKGKGRKIHQKLEEVAEGIKAQSTANLANSNNVRRIKKQVSISSENFVMCKMTDFENDYEIVDKLGEGSFGSVFRVKHKVLGLLRALKKIRKDPSAQFSKFEQIQILKKLDHSNILKIYEFYETKEYYMIITDIFEGRELIDEIVDCEKISEEIGSRIIREVLVTLNYTHSMGIAHRDIKPENILVKNIQDKGKFKLKIIDWGLGTLIQEKLSDRVCGTPEYAAPEIFQGKYSTLCDMWSLGILTFILLTGNMPFKGSNTQQTISQVKRCIINYRKAGFNQLSQPAKQFISNLIQKQPSKRMTAKVALEHPWITQHNIVQEQPKVLAETLVRLKQLNINNHFGVAVINLLNNHFSSAEEKDRLQEVFKFLDANGDGVISKEELVLGYSKIYGAALAESIAEETFSKLDVNNSGTLEFSQFIAFGLRREKQKEKEKLKQAFDLFDEDKNGMISWKEVEKILIGKLEGYYEQDMQQVLADAKTNGAQEINFQNFYKFMETLLSKVDFIRESRKNSSVIRSQLQKNSVKKVQAQTIQLKRTVSQSQSVQIQKQTEKPELETPRRKCRK